MRGVFALSCASVVCSVLWFARCVHVARVVCRVFGVCDYCMCEVCVVIVVCVVRVVHVFVCARLCPGWVPPCACACLFG